MRSSGVCAVIVLFFFFQAEDGIRDLTVTGVQTCALPISFAVFIHRSEYVSCRGRPLLVCWLQPSLRFSEVLWQFAVAHSCAGKIAIQIGRASCRERV